MKFNFLQYEKERYLDYLKTKEVADSCRWCSRFDFGTSTINFIPIKIGVL